MGKPHSFTQLCHPERSEEPVLSVAKEPAPPTRGATIQTFDGRQRVGPDGSTQLLSS